MAKLTYDVAISTLKASKVTIDCKTVVKYLEELGYEVDKSASGNHYTYTNVALDFYGGNFNCGHGKNPDVKPLYIDKICKILSKHNKELKEKINEGKEDE